jgi:hypothetical protein
MAKIKREIETLELEMKAPLRIRQLEEATVRKRKTAHKTARFSIIQLCVDANCVISSTVSLIPVG